MGQAGTRDAHLEDRKLGDWIILRWILAEYVVITGGV
jgi:hypothetical protein